MTGEIIGNDVQPEGGIEEVLLPPVRSGLKRSLRDRKTRLKDINYHLAKGVELSSSSEMKVRQIQNSTPNRKLDQSLSSVWITAPWDPNHWDVKSRSDWSFDSWCDWPINGKYEKSFTYRVKVRFTKGQKWGQPITSLEPIFINFKILFASQIKFYNDPSDRIADGAPQTMHQFKRISKKYSFEHARLLYG